MALSKLHCLLVNQTIGPLFSDVILAAQARTRTTVFRGIKYRRSPVFCRVSTWLAYSIQLAWHLFWNATQYDKLLIVSNPPFAPLLALIARRPYSLLIYDLYPQILSQVQPRSYLLRFFLYLIVHFWHIANKRILSGSDRIFTLSMGMADQLRPYFSNDRLWRERVIVIPPWADTSVMCPCPEESKLFRRTHDIDGFFLSYSGNLGLTHPLEPLLEACSMLQRLPSSPQIQMLIIGDGPKRDSLEMQARELQLPQRCLRFLNPLPYSELPASLTAADLTVVALDGPSAASSLPSKTFNALATGTPILSIAPVHSALALLIKEHNCGFVIEPGPNASQQLVELIIHILENPHELQQISSNALSASRLYTPNNAVDLIDSWLGL